MITIWLYSLISVFVVSAISLVGVFTLSVQENTLKNMLTSLIAFSAGAMLGDVFIHLLPEIVEKGGFDLHISYLVLSGIILTFVIEKVIHWQHHRGEVKNKPHPMTTLTLFGDGVHNFIDGLIIGGSYLVSPAVGFATTLAVILHEIPQEIGNFGVLIHGGYSKRKALWYNFLSALTAVIGTVIALSIGGTNEASTIALTAFTAGTFIYIVGSDLIPELHKEVGAKKSIIQFIWLLLGIGVMMGLLVLE